MSDRPFLSRRDFLRLSAMAAVSALAASCAPSQPSDEPAPFAIEVATPDLLNLRRCAQAGKDDGRVQEHEMTGIGQLYRHGYLDKTGAPAFVFNPVRPVRPELTGIVVKPVLCEEGGTGLGKLCRWRPVAAGPRPGYPFQGVESMLQGCPFLFER